MMSNRPRPPPPRKRKDREPPSDPTPAPAQRGPQSGAARLGCPAEQAGGSRLLAGYLAHEYLTRGTLLGRPVGAAPEAGREQKASAAPAAVPAGPYAEVSQLLMCKNGAHVPGVVNPAQLAQWLRM